MLSFLKREKSKQLEDQLNAAQAQRRTGWENLPEDELFTPAGFSEEQAEATASSNYSYWGSTFRAFFKNKFAVALLIALVVVVAFAFIQPHLPGQADPNLCAVDPVTGIQYRNIAPGQDGFIWGSNSIGQDLWARIWAGARTSLTIAFFVALIEAVVGITAGVLWGYVRGLDFVFTELYNIFDNIPTAIVLILISYVATPPASGPWSLAWPSRAGSKWHASSATRSSLSATGIIMWLPAASARPPSASYCATCCPTSSRSSCCAWPSPSRKPSATRCSSPTSVWACPWRPPRWATWSTTAAR